MTGAIFCESRPATIIKSACRGEGRNTSAPNRATSNRAAAIDIISIAQHAKPNPSGQIELFRAQFTALSSVVKMIPSSSSSLPKSSGFVSVTCFPNDVLMFPRSSIFAHAHPRNNLRLSWHSHFWLGGDSAVRNHAFRLIIAPMSTTPSPLRQSPHLRLHCVNVFVRDQDRSLRFFVDQLGFNVAFDTRVQSGERWVGVAPPDGAAILSLIVPKPNSEQYKLIGRATQVVFVTEDVTSKFLEWSKRGVRFHSTPRLKRIRYQTHAAQNAAVAVAAASESAETSSTVSRTHMLLGEETPIWGGTVARFRDIDGNAFSLVSFDEFTYDLEAER